MKNDIVTLIEEIKTVSSKIIKKDISTIDGFNERQIEAIAKQTKMIKNGIITGAIDNDLKVFFIKGLEDMTLNFVNTLKGLLAVMLEKLWNAIVEVLLKVINLAL